MKKYQFHSDSGHGWLQVEIEEIRRLGIKDQISGFSYMQGKFAYLEEDCDAPCFLNKKTELSEPIDFEEVYTNNDSPIRDFTPYNGSYIVN